VLFKKGRNTKDELFIDASGEYTEGTNQNRLGEPPTLPTRTTWYLTDLAEARGKQELFIRHSSGAGRLPPR
jgi:hypothetical protein